MEQMEFCASTIVSNWYDFVWKTLPMFIYEHTHKTARIIQFTLFSTPVRNFNLELLGIALALMMVISISSVSINFFFIRFFSDLNPMCSSVLFWWSNTAVFESTNRDDNLEDALESCWPSKEYALIVHGFTESCTTPWAVQLRQSKMEYTDSHPSPALAFFGLILFPFIHLPITLDIKRFDSTSWWLYHLYGLQAICW